MNKTGKYLYGIINSNTDFHLYAGKDSGGAPPFDSKGRDRVEKVYTIPYQDISAVVSDSEIVDYTHMLKDALARRLLIHQQLIERIMNLDHTIIPVRLGTFAIDELEVKDVLIKGYNLIKDIVEKVSGKIEIDVVAAWSDFDSVLTGLSEEAQIKELKQVFLSKKAGLTIDDQMKIGVLIRNYLDKKREKVSNEIQISLNRFTQDFKVHALMDDKMVLNVAYLLDKSRKEDFEKRIEELNTEFSEKLNFRCVGPLPPYSFYTLEVKNLQFEEIDWARKKLGLLNESATKNDIKKAHQSLAISTHPDKNPDTPGIERQFDEVTRAYKILSEYCQGEACAFNEKDFKKNAILVKVRG